MTAPAWPGRTLALDGAGADITVARFDDGRLVAEAVAERGRGPGAGAAERLPAVVWAALGEAGGVDRVVVGAGPGSFTGLRAGGALAKGIAHARGVSLLAVPSLALAAAGAALRGEVPATGRVLVVLDALRGEWFQQEVTLLDGEVVDVSSVRRGAWPPEWDGPVVGGPERPARPEACHAARCRAVARAVALREWAPEYGRLAEAEAQWLARQLAGGGAGG